MEEKDIEIFLENLNLNLGVYSFESLVTTPASFSSLGKINIISDTAALRSLKLQEPSAGYRGYGKPLKNFLRAFKPQGSDVDDEEYIDFSNRNLKEALAHLNAFLDDENLNALKEVIKRSRDESELETGLGIHLIGKLAGKAYTSNEKSMRCCPCGCLEKMPENENMWIGAKETWYGELDILAGNRAIGESVSVTVKQNDVRVDQEIQNDDNVLCDNKDYLDKEITEEKDESPGEALNQVTSQAVVFAFTEYNRHKSRGNCIPSILLDRNTFQYVIYCPVDDILLVSNHMVYTSPEDFDKKTGYRPFVVLWIILNHRLFFRKHPDFSKRFIKSGFHENMQNLEAFQNLIDYSKVISVKRNYHFAINDTPNTIGIPAMEWFLDK